MIDFSREDLIHVLKKHWGYDSFRPCQEDIIQSILTGHDTLGLMPTGGGKSLTFQVPAMLLKGLTIVVTPLISLMKDQVDNLKARNIPAAYLCTGVTRREEELVLEKALYGKIKLLYLSPEKLASVRFLSKIETLPVDLIVADEAHCISQWGYDFRPQYLKLGEMRNRFEGVPVLALTASATEEVSEDIRKQLQFKKGNQTFRLSFKRPNISYLVRHTEDKISTMTKILTAVDGSAIIYVRSRKKTHEYADALCKAGFSADCYHAGLDPEDKTERQNRWKSGETRIIVATNAFGMGIDKPDVRLVLHVDLPPSLEEYYQEAGRAGRDGNPSYAVLILSKKDRGSLDRKLAASFPPKDEIRKIYGLLASYFNLSAGEGYDTSFEFSIESFCKTYRLFPDYVANILNILTISGVIEYIDEVARRSRIMMTMYRDELYSHKFTPVQEKLMQAILRKYTGIFSDYEFISEYSLCHSCNIPEDQIYQLLIELRKSNVLDYIPRQVTPYIYYTTSQEDPEHLLIPQTAYEFRYERMKKRMDAMKDFAYTDNCCRTKILLEYFGEKDAEVCGKCDWCRANSGSKTSSRQSPENIRALESWIISTVRNNPLSINDLIASSGYTSRQSQQSLINSVRTLADAGQLQIDGSYISIPNT